MNKGLAGPHQMRFYSFDNFFKLKFSGLLERCFFDKILCCRATSDGPIRETVMKSEIVDVGAQEKYFLGSGKKYL